jgi:hypothetical protein
MLAYEEQIAMQRLSGSMSPNLSVFFYRMAPMT